MSINALLSMRKGCLKFLLYKIAYGFFYVLGIPIRLAISALLILILAVWITLSLLLACSIIGAIIFFLIYKSTGINVLKVVGEWIMDVWFDFTFKTSLIPREVRFMYALSMYFKHINPQAYASLSSEALARELKNTSSLQNTTKDSVVLAVYSSYLGWRDKQAIISALIMFDGPTCDNLHVNQSLLGALHDALKYEFRYCDSDLVQQLMQQYAARDNSSQEKLLRPYELLILLFYLDVFLKQRKNTLILIDSNDAIVLDPFLDFVITFCDATNTGVNNIAAYVSTRIYEFFGQLNRQQCLRECYQRLVELLLFSVMTKKSRHIKNNLFKLTPVMYLFLFDISLCSNVFYDRYNVKGNEASCKYLNKVLQHLLWGGNYDLLQQYCFFIGGRWIEAHPNSIFNIAHLILFKDNRRHCLSDQLDENSMLTPKTSPIQFPNNMDFKEDDDSKLFMHVTKTAIKQRINSCLTMLAEKLKLNIPESIMGIIGFYLGAHYIFPRFIPPPWPSEEFCGQGQVMLPEVVEEQDVRFGGRELQERHLWI